MLKWLRKLLLYIKAKKTWDAKMSEHLKIRITSVPLKDKEGAKCPK